MMMDIHARFHHLVEVESRAAAADGHAEGVADEGLSVVIGEKPRVLGEYLALGGILQVLL